MNGTNPNTPPRTRQGSRHDLVWPYPYKPPFTKLAKTLVLTRWRSCCRISSYPARKQLRSPVSSESRSHALDGPSTRKHYSPLRTPHALETVRASSKKVLHQFGIRPKLKIKLMTRLSQVSAHDESVRRTNELSHSRNLRIITHAAQLASRQPPQASRSHNTAFATCV